MKHQKHIRIGVWSIRHYGKISPFSFTKATRTPNANIILARSESLTSVSWPFLSSTARLFANWQPINDRFSPSKRRFLQVISTIGRLKRLSHGSSRSRDFLSFFIAREVCSHFIAFKNEWEFFTRDGSTAPRLVKGAGFV